EKTPQARAAFRKDPDWMAPVLWRSEFRNILGQYMRRGALSLSDALQLIREAELLMEGAEYEVESSQVLSLVASSRCSAYDCEFPALAREVGVPIVTSDVEITSRFPGTAIPLETYG